MKTKIFGLLMAIVLVIGLMVACGDDTDSGSSDKPHEHSYTNGLCSCGQLEPGHEHVSSAPVRENVVEATCSKAGSYVEVVKCTVCGLDVSRTTKVIEKLDHTKVITEENKKDATCSSAGSYVEVITCSVCNEEISRTDKVIEKLAHTEVITKENVINSTCSDEGSYIEVVTCSVCKEEISRTTKVIEKIAHTAQAAVRENVVDATCSAEGSYDEVVYCSVCKEEISRVEKTIDKAVHTLGEAVQENLVPATCTAMGSYDRVIYCSVCNEEVYRTKVSILKVAHSYVEGVCSCGQVDANYRPPVDIPPSTDLKDTYQVKFVYKYFLTYINDFDRMESKTFTINVASNPFEVPVDNDGFTAEDIEKIKALSYNGYGFAGWYDAEGWDDNNYTIKDGATAVDFENLAIDGDMTFYAYRGNLAGAGAHWSIETVGEGKNQETILTLSGEGALFDYAVISNIDIPWYAERAKITKIVVEEGITHIGANTFNSLYAADDVTLPSTLESIGNSAFRGMTKFTYLETPANLKTIGTSAFAETALKSVVLNEGLVEIGDSAFNQSNKIVSIVVPKSLEHVRTGAFHPGSTDGKVNSTALKYVYYLGTEEEFANMDVALDNAWFNELSSVYCTPAEGVDPDVVKGPYWKYYSYEDAETGETVVTNTPVPYYYMIKYLLNSSVYGLYTPITIDYVPTEVSMNDDGSLSISATVNKSNVEFAENIVYHNFKFVRYSNGVTEGMKLFDDRSVTCEVYLGTRVSPSETAVGSNKGYLSNKGGLVWEFNFATKTLTISVGAKAVDLDGIIAAVSALAKDYKGEITGDTVISDIFDIITAADIAEIAENVGLSDAAEFEALANKLATLELSSANDPLIATAQVLAEQGIVTVEDLGAFIVAMAVEGCADDCTLHTGDHIVGCAEDCILHTGSHIVGCADDCTLHTGNHIVGCADDCTLHTGKHIVGCVEGCTEHADGEHIVGCAADCTAHNGEEHIVGCAADCTAHNGEEHIIGCAEGCELHNGEEHIVGCADDCTAHNGLQHIAGADEDAALQAKLAALAEASLDAQNLKDLYNKLCAAAISGSIEAEFTALSTQLAALENVGILVTDIHAAMIARENTIAALAEAVAKEYLVGNVAAFDSAITVADLANAASALQDSEGLFKTWDYETTEDTSVMWASSRSYTNYVQKIVIEEGVQHIGKFAFAALPNVREIVIPASVESIDTNAFSGCSALNSIYYAGSDLNTVKIFNASRGAGYEVGTLYKDNILQGTALSSSVYAYTETAQSGEGKFWMNAGDTKVAWWLTGSKLFIGGPTVMYNFATPEEAPWYGAKDNIDEVSIANFITHIGENIANGYANVMDLDIGDDFGAVRSIPKSAFEGTGVLLGNSKIDKYNKNGYLVVDHYLLAYNGEAKDLEVPSRTVSIAEGAFDNVADLYSVFVPHTVLGMHENVFYNNTPTIIFFKGTSESWNTQCGNLVFPEDAEYYVALSDKKATDNGDFFFKYEEIDGERVITEGCIHIYSEWVVTLDPTCSKTGLRERTCSGSCGKTFTEAVPALGHNWTAWTPCADAPTYEERWCQNENCDAKCSVVGCTIHADHIVGCDEDCTAHNGEHCITEGCADDCTLHTGNHIVGCEEGCTLHTGNHIVGCEEGCTLHTGNHIVGCEEGCELHTGSHTEECAEGCTLHNGEEHIVGCEEGCTLHNGEEHIVGCEEGCTLHNGEEHIAGCEEGCTLHNGEEHIVACAPDCTLHTGDHIVGCADDCTAHKQAAHEKVLINSEYTFEGIEEVKDNQIKLSDTTNSKYTIVAVDTESHIFEYEKLSAGVNAEFTVFATQAGNLDTAKVITYKSDLKIDNTNKKVSIDLVFRSEADPSVKSLVLNLLATDGKKLDIGAKNSGDYASIGVKTGEWFNLKVEYYAEGDVAVAKVYVDDKLVYITDAYEGSAESAAPVSAASVDSVAFIPSANYLGKISLDNVTLVQADEYEFDGETTLIKPITFDEIPPASIMKVDGTATIVEKDGNKYYSINRTSSSGYYTFYPTSSANSANVAIFETDLQITRNEGSRAWAIRLLGGSTGNAYMAEFRHDANTQVLYVADKSHSQDAIGYKSEYIQPTDAAGTPVEIKVGDWVNVRIEYYEAKAGDAESVRILTYINDVLVLYSNNWYGVTTEQETGSAGTVPHPAKISEITGAYIQPYTSHRGEWNVDNSIFYTTYATAPTAPVELKYDDYSGGAIDNGGVIRTDWVQEDDRANALKNLINEPVDEDEEDIYVPEDTADSAPLTFDDMAAIEAYIALEGGATASIEQEGTNSYFYFERIVTASTSKRFKIWPTGDASKLPAEADTVVFESKIKVEAQKIDGTKSTTFQLIMMDRNSGGDYANRAYLLEIDIKDGNILVKDKSHNTDSLVPADGKVDPVATTAKAGEWFTLRCEYNEKGEAKTYVNGALVLTSDNFYGYTTENAAATPVQAEIVDCVYVSPYNNFSGYIALDNTYFWREQSEVKSIVTFDDIDAVPAIIAPQTTTCNISLVTEDSNKFVRISKEDTSGSNRFTISLTEDGKEDATSTVFEAKVRYNFVTAVDGKPNSATNMFFIQDLNTGARAFEFQFNVEDGKMVFYTVAAGGTDYTTDKTVTNVSVNEWFDLKLEYTDAGSLKVSVNGDVVLVSTNFYTQTEAAYDAASVNSVWFVPFGNVKGNIDFDNLYFYQVADEAVEPPHEHKFVDGVCSDCGEADPDYVPEVPVLIPEGAVDFENVSAFPVSSGVVEVKNESQTGASQYTDAEGQKVTVYDEGGKAIPQFKGTVSIVDGVLRIVDVSAKSYTTSTTDPEIAKTEDLGQAMFRFVPKSAIEGNTIVFQTRVRIAPLESGAKNYGTAGGGIDLRMSYGTAKADNFMWATLFVKGGKLALSDNSNTANVMVSTANEGDFATLTFVYTYDEAAGTATAKVIITDKDGVSTEADFTAAVKDPATFLRCSAIFNKPFQGIAEFDNVFVGGEITYPEPPKPQVIPENALTFDEMSAGDWTTNGTGSVLIGLGKQDGASIEPTVAVVAEGANKYLSFTKKNGDTVKMAWLVFQNNSGVTTADTLYFDAKMRMTKLGGNNETHIRFYKDRLVSKADAGTEISSAGRIKITAPDGVLTIGGISTGLAAGEWFTLRLVFTTEQVVVFVAGEDGVFAPVTSFAMDFSTYSSLQFTNQNNDQSTFDFDWVYYGGEYNAEEPDEGGDDVEVEEEEVLPGTNTFEESFEGAYIFDATAATKVNHIISGANAVGETSIVVDENGNKYFQMVKSQGASGSAQTWIAVERTLDVPAGTPVVFEAKMSISYTNGSSAYLRFYKNRPASTGTGGTCAGVTSKGTSTNNGNVMFNYHDGTLHIDRNSSEGYANIDLGVGKAEWFTLRLVMSGTTIVVYLADENGKFVEMGKIERPEWTFDLEECNGIVYMNDSPTTMTVCMDNVYFGPYVPDVESPIENLPVKESELPEGNISFNDIEETVVPEQITLLTDGDSALGVVAVSKSNKVLYLDKAAEADARVYLNATKKTVGANVLSFATQMYFDTLNADGYVDFTLMPSGSAEADRVYKIRLSASAEGNLTIATVSLVDGADVVGEATDTGVAVGEWFKLSIVYTENNDTFTVSVNGEAKLTADAPYGMLKDASAISQILILASDALEADIYFENMSLSQIIAE